MKKLIFFATITLFISCSAQKITTQSEDKDAILKVMKDQEKAWSQNDLEGFMQGYWKSDSLKFYGSGGLTKGWQQTLDNYKKGYPTKDHSGTLTFEVDDISPIEANSYWVHGTLLFKKKCR